MPHLLPPKVLLRSENPVQLVIQDGAPVLVGGVNYPAFYVHRDDVARHLPEFERLKSRYGDHWPAQPTAEGLVWDPAWNAFVAFFADKYSSGFERVLEDIAKKKVAWSLCCPVIEGPESVIGQVMRQYGKTVGGQPGSPGFNPAHAMRDHPIETLLEKAKGLPDFRDRGLSLLDLAMQNQLWPVAEWLWQKGVRPTTAFLRGPYLESLVIASHALQESPVTGFLRNKEDRAEWLSTWLARFEQSGEPVSQERFSTWRQRTLVKNMGASVADRVPIVDNAPGFWLAHAVHSHPTRTPKVEEAAHQWGLFDAWAAFWARQGIDWEGVAVQSWVGDELVGATAFFDALRRPELAGWQARLQTITQAVQLDDQTPDAQAKRSSPRL